MQKIKNEIVRLGLILFIITAISGFALAFVNDLTENRIAENSTKAKNEAMRTIFAEAETFEKFEIQPNEIVSEAYEAKKGEETIGYVVSASPSGYGGPIEMMIGIDKEGKITDYQVTSLSETPGLGTRVKDDEFKGQFKGKSYPVELTKIPSENKVTAISGATISSNAVVKGINAALETVQTKVQGGGK